MKLVDIDSKTKGTFFRCLHDEIPEDFDVTTIRREWTKDYMKKGLRAKVLIDDNDGVVDVLILGDTNIDVTKANAPQAKLYLSALKNLGLSQMNRSPTRTTLHSKTNIDHCITNREDLYHTVGCIDLGLSDHCLIYTNRKKLRIPHKYLL